MEGSGTYVEGRGGAKGNGPCHAVKWGTDGRGENGTEGDMIGGGPMSILQHFGPLPFIKGRMAKGVWNFLSVINLGTPLLTI
jgi:hypothetical protein